MRWFRDPGCKKHILWLSRDREYVIQRGTDNDAELKKNGIVLFRGTEDQCKQHAEKQR